MVILVICIIGIIILVFRPICQAFKDGWNAASLEIENRDKPIDNDINPFTEDIERLTDQQKDTLIEQLKLLDNLLAAETDDKKRSILLNKITTTQNKLLRITQKQHNLYDKSRG